MRSRDQPRSGCLTDLLGFPWHDAARRMLEVHRLVMLVGEPGVGKTRFARAAAQAATCAEPEVLQGTPETELGHLWGFFSLVGGETSFRDGPLPRALKDGRYLVVEEFNLIPLEVRASLLALRGQGAVHNPFTGEQVRVPDPFRLLATSNPESIACRRTGQVARALLDDFLILEVPRLTTQQVARLLRMEFPGAGEARVQQVLARWCDFEQIDVASDDAAKVRLSYRAARHLMALLEAGLPEASAVEIALANKYIIDPDAHATAKLRLSMD